MVKQTVTARLADTEYHPLPHPLFQFDQSSEAGLDEGLINPFTIIFSNFGEFMQCSLERKMEIFLAEGQGGIWTGYKRKAVIGGGTAIPAGAGCEAGVEGSVGCADGDGGLDGEEMRGCQRRRSGARG